MKTSFKDGGLQFINDLANKNGTDLGYSLALEAGNVFVIVVAYPSMTKKRFNTEKERIMFHIPEDEYDMDQNKLIDRLSEQIQDHMYFVDEENITNET